jgi:hypothetical protein
MNSNSDQISGSEYQQLADKLYALEQRLTRLEAVIRPSDMPVGTAESEVERLNRIKTEEEAEERLESNFGEYGLAWLGNIVLFFGIVFLVEYLRRSGFVVISPALGFAAVAGIFGLARYFRNSNPYMAKIFNLNVYLLVYYVILKLHFFTSSPVIPGKAIELILLLLVITLLLIISASTKYALLTGLSLILLSITAVVSDSTHLMLALASLISVISMIFLFRFGWIYQVYLSVTLFYLICLLWMVGNPPMGHSVQIISNHQYGFNWIFLSSAVFSLIALMPERKESYTSESIIGAVVYNGAGFVFTMGICFLSFFKDTFALPSGSIAVYCMAYAVVLKVRTNWKITGAIYALSGFVALSVAIFGIYGFPRAWTLLSVQSLLVISMAIWFKSRFVVIMNTLMYAMLLLLYLATSHSFDLANISFTLTALITARMLNWAKSRISISTVFIRNLYLVTAFFMVLYTLYHLIPRQYVTLSWSLAAVVYFLLSLLLKNVKYRYMALGTMVSAALFLLLVDLAYVELAFRVLALLFLAIISIGLSLYYNKKLKKKVEQ